MFRRTDHRSDWRRLTLRAAFGVLLIVPAYAMANEPTPEWNPESSERLVKLPATYLKKSLDHDFAQSALGTALQGTHNEIDAKARTLSDLQSAVVKSSGEMRVEMRHQFLQEKRAYVELMSRKNELERKHVAVQTRLLEDVLERMRPGTAGETAAHQELVKRQEAARERFESSIARVDMALFKSSAMPESKYSVKYAENTGAIETLMARIKTHNMNETSVGDDETMTKEDYIRQMLADAQAQVALLDQEDTILGYMAKLVALDAMALAEDALDTTGGDSIAPMRSAPAAVAPLFISN